MNKLIHMQNVYNIVGVQFSSSKLIVTTYWPLVGYVNIFPFAYFTV